MEQQHQKRSVGKLWAELKRRRVVRAVLIYLVAGWVIIEVASTVMPNLNLPDWSVTLVTVLIVLGLPLVITLAWVFDVGPEGIERTNAAGDGSGAEAPPRPTRPSQPTAPGSDGEERRSVAVLPFVNMSGDAANEYFSDGISEEILNLLTKLPQLRVASRTSSFAFKGKDFDIPTVARKLGVGIVLEGSVRRAGDHVRITAQLIDTDTDSHLWSETYDRELKDVFAIQDDIAHSIVQALKVTLTPKERRSIQYVATSDPKAFDFYLRGRQYMYSMVKRDYEHAIRMFEQAIALDSKYALAYAGIADARSHLYRYADATPENAARAVDASEKAVTLDPDSAEAHASKGLALFISEKYDEAEVEFDRAIDLNPNLFEAYYYYGLACSSKRDFQKAVGMYRKAMEVNPNDYQSPLFLAQAYASMGRKQDEMRIRLESLNTIQRHLELNPHDTRAIYCAANNLVSIGEKEKGREMAERALGQDENEPVVLYNVACICAVQGDPERSLELLERAVEQGWGDRAWLETDSDLDSLRNNPRFQSLLDKVD